MARSLHVSEFLALPLSSVTETFAVLGQRGTGKTTAATVMVEEMASAGARSVVIDPTGAWWGLAHPGAGDGVEAIVLGG
jgi:DNA helicase HerA-like ATPase